MPPSLAARTRSARPGEGSTRVLVGGKPAANRCFECLVCFYLLCSVLQHQAKIAAKQAKKAGRSQAAPAGAGSSFSASQRVPKVLGHGRFRSTGEMELRESRKEMERRLSYAAESDAEVADVADTPAQPRPSAGALERPPALASSLTAAAAASGPGPQAPQAVGPPLPVANGKRARMCARCKQLGHFGKTCDADLTPELEAAWQALQQKPKRQVKKKPRVAAVLGGASASATHALALHAIGAAPETAQNASAIV